MLYQILLGVSVLAILLTYLTAGYLTLRQHLKPFARSLIVALIVFEVIAAVLHLLSVNGAFQTGYWAWFLGLQNERNLGALFSSMQLMLVALIALANAVWTPGLKPGQRAYWLLVVVLFAYLSIDEFYAIHETFGGGGPSDNYQLPYAVGLVTFTLISAGAFWFGFRRDFRLFAFLFAGLAITIYSGVVTEELVSEAFDGVRWMTIFEEVGEMIGATIALMGVITYADKHLSAVGWSLGKRLTVTGGLAWTAWMCAALFLLPALELRLRGTPVQVNYENNQLSLLGYEVAPDSLNPTDDVTLTLYLRANQPLTTDYRVSAHAVAHPEIDSAAQSDNLHIGPIPTTAWFPGVVMKTSISVHLPRNLITPASYWLTLRVWSGDWPFGRPWEETDGLMIVQSENRQLLAEDTVILASLPVFPADSPAAAESASYRFNGEGFVMRGYALPADAVQTHALPVKFWWEANAKPQRNLTQFFHLVDADSGDLVTFDQQPFGGRLPTIDWPSEMNAMDQWSLALPEDMPAGRYEVYTGLYDSTTLERAGVVGGDGQPVQDNRIYLGTIEYAPSAEAEEAARRLAMNVCYGVSDTNSVTGNEADTLVRMNVLTGETVEIGQTGSVKVEGITFSPDRTRLYAVDEREEIGLFGIFDLESGAFTSVGSGLVTPDALARNAALGEAMLKDIDSIVLEPETGFVWGVQQDQENLLFRIDVDSGEVVRDAFGEGYDYLKIDLSNLPAPGYVNVKDMAVDPRSGTFYLVVGNESFDSLLATLDFESADLETGLIHVQALMPPVSVVDSQPIRDMEGLTFAPDGTLYATSSNNSNTPANFDMLWRVDPTTGNATPVDSFANYVDYVDYEAIACNSSEAVE